MKYLADIVNEENWCRGVLAIDAIGKEVGIHSPKAVRRCMIGWMRRKYTASPKFTAAEIQEANDRVYAVCFRRYKKAVMVVNDRLVKDAAEVASIFAEARV